MEEVRYNIVRRLGNQRRIGVNVKRSILFWCFIISLLGIALAGCGVTNVASTQTKQLDTTKWMALDANSNLTHEEECYTPSQVTLPGGTLTITAVAQTTSCSQTTKPYDSGGMVLSPSLNTIGFTSGNFLYGTITFTAEMPGGQGPWPAVWLLGHNCHPQNATTYTAPTCNWPNPGSDEIDITEVLNSNHVNDSQCIHSSNGSPCCDPGLSDVSQNFHNYELDWSPGTVTWKIDGNITCTNTSSSVPSQSMYLILNVAMGGAGGTPNNSTLPQSMLVTQLQISQNGALIFDGGFSSSPKNSALTSRALPTMAGGAAFAVELSGGRSLGALRGSEGLARGPDSK
jgi:Glycosyl hydrolases family 16